MRLIWLGLGWSAVGLGTAGIVLPLVPTTPFLLLAAFCFARSSERIHDWLVNHPRLGPGIRNWREHGAIGRGSKLGALLALASALVFSVISGMDAWIIGVQLAVAVAVAAFILSRPTGPRAAG